MSKPLDFTVLAYEVTSDNEKRGIKAIASYFEALLWKFLKSDLDFKSKPKIFYQVQETWKFFFLTHIQLCVNSLF